MNKIYFVESEMYSRVGFQSESDRNEMALALYEEHIYFLTMRIMNWYGSEGILSGVEEAADSNVFTWEEYESFDAPTQIAFWEAEQELYIGGIAYGEEIICGCCGGVIDIKEVYEFAPEGIEPIVTYDDWANIDEFIIHENEQHFRMED